MPKLYIAEDGAEAVYEIFDHEVTLGRGAANAVQLVDSHASKMHVVVRRIEGHWKVVDLESKNGTRVNGRYRNQHWLSDGDTLTIGEATVRFAADGAPQGSPAAAAGIAAKPVAARPVAAAAPAPARPAVPAQPAVPAPAAPAVPAQPAVAAPAAAMSSPPMPAAAAPAPAPAVSRSRRASGAAAPARKRRPPQDEGYDDEYYDEEDDLPPVRRKSNSGPIIAIGIVAALAFFGIMFALFGGGPSENLQVFRTADRMADQRQYEAALKYAEQNADPDGEDYVRVLKAIETWKKMVGAQKQGELEQAARDYFDREIFRKQAVTGRRRGGFRAKDAYPEPEVARLLQAFLKDYPHTAAAATLMGDETADYNHLRDCMRENPNESLRSRDVWGAMQATFEIDLAARKFADAYLDLDYAKSAYRLVMTSENYSELRKTLEMKLDEVLDMARRRFEDDANQFKGFLAEGRRGSARKTLSDMKDHYGGIPEFASKITALEQRL